MKKTYILLAAFLAVCTAVPGMAQSNNSSLANKVKRAALKAVAQIKAHKHSVCAHCGQEITDPHQHCAATDYIGLCTTNVSPNQPKKVTDETPSACPKCGAAYTIDEKYHDVPHVCPVQKDQTSLNAGPNGGEPECGAIFIESSEPAAQRGPNGGEPETNFFCVESEDENVNRGPNGGEPEGPSYVEIDAGALYQAESLLQADRDAHNGYPKHDLKYYYKQIVSKKSVTK